MITFSKLTREISETSFAEPEKGLYKRFSCIPGTGPILSQGRDLDMGINLDIEIVQEDTKLPHLEFYAYTAEIIRGTLTM